MQNADVVCRLPSNLPLPCSLLQVTADQITAKCAALLSVSGSGTAGATVVDLTACVGGNVLSFAKRFGHVVGVEVDAQRFELLAHNVSVTAASRGVASHSQGVTYPGTSSRVGNGGGGVFRVGNVSLVQGDALSLLPTGGDHAASKPASKPASKHASKQHTHLSPAAAVSSVVAGAAPSAVATPGALAASGSMAASGAVAAPWAGASARGEPLLFFLDPPWGGVGYKDQEVPIRAYASISDVTAGSAGLDLVSSMPDHSSPLENYFCAPMKLPAGSEHCLNPRAPPQPFPCR